MHDVLIRTSDIPSAMKMRHGPGRIRPYYDRLVALKNKRNPTNFFRMCQNIEPSS